jgi:ATPase subunit of ABC transporter with duplicated ATPase domains
MCYIEQKKDMFMSDVTVMKALESAYEKTWYWISDGEIISTLLQYWFDKSCWHLPVSSLSFGQKVRLQFAQISRWRFDLLLMDEPTNHLDIPTREAIEEALSEYEWAFVLVSHDRYFVDEVMITQKRALSCHKMSIVSYI